VLAFARRAPVCLVGYVPDAAITGGSGRRQRRVAPQSERWPNRETAPSKDVDDDDDEPCLVSTQEGQGVARQIGAVAYIEWTGGRYGSCGQMAQLARYGYDYRFSKSAECQSTTSSRLRRFRNRLWE
jgi:hypothetical protein